MPQTLDFSSINHSSSSAGVRTAFVKEMSLSKRGFKLHTKGGLTHANFDFCATATPELR